MTLSGSNRTPDQTRIGVLYVTPSPPKSETGLLSTDGLTVEVRTDTEAALDAAGADVDCIVAGHDPPALDARRLLERLRDAGHDQPFVLYGPKIRSGVVEAVVSAGGDYLCSESDTRTQRVLAARIRRLVDADRTRKQLELKSRAMEQAPVGITIAEAEPEDEPLVYVNEQFEQMTGYKRSDMMGRNCRLLQGAGTDESVVSRLREAIERRDPIAVELLNYHRDGTPFWNQLDVAPVRENGEVTHFFGFQKDVTERKTLEEDLRRQTELQDRFASVVSHDLRNPLGLAKGRLQIARDERDGPHLEEVADALDRMDNLIDEVLRMARHGTAVTDPQSVDLTAVVRRASDIVGPAVTVVVDDLETVEGAPERLCTLFENLFRNAVEHGAQPASGRFAPGDALEHGSTSSREREDGDPADGVDVVSVRVGPTDDGFYVEDDGPGIPEDDRASVFDWDVTTTEHGTGYGLAVVRTIARAHGWEVSATEGEEGGARFEFVLDARPNTAL